VHLHKIAIQVCPKDPFSSWTSRWPICAVIEGEFWCNCL
jgi:hypothetical protein